MLLRVITKLLHNMCFNTVSLETSQNNVVICEREYIKFHTFELQLRHSNCLGSLGFSVIEYKLLGAGFSLSGGKR